MGFHRCYIFVPECFRRNPFAFDRRVSLHVLLSELPTTAVQDFGKPVVPRHSHDAPMQMNRFIIDHKAKPQASGHHHRRDFRSDKIQ